MLFFLVRRIGMLLFTLLGISAAIFLIVQVLPGDAVDAMLEGWVEESGGAYDILRAKLGLDRPLHEQYFTWLWNIAGRPWAKSCHGCPIAPRWWSVLILIASRNSCLVYRSHT